MRTRIAVACIAGLATIGCGGKADETKTANQTSQTTPAGGTTPGAQQAAQGAQQMAQGLQQMAQGLQQPNGQAVKVVDSDELKALLPDMSGWEKQHAKGEMMSMGIVSFSNAQAQYMKGDQTIKLEITDAALNQMMLAGLSMFLMSGYSEKSDDGYKKYATVNGMPGFESWDKNDKHAEVTAVVGNRFVVKADSSEIDSVDPVRKLVESVDFAKLTAKK